MKLSFSTLACPNYSWQETLSIAKDLGFDGIEVREVDTSLKSSPFSPDKIASTALEISKLRIEIPCLSTGCCLKLADKAEENFREIKTYIDVASSIGTKYIRVLADLEPAPAGEVDDELISCEIKKLVPYAEEKGVTMLIESNGVYSDTKRLNSLLNMVASDYVAALWDTHHTVRFGGETPEQTLQNLGAYIKHVHVKDSKADGNNISYRLMGEGDMPFGEIFDALRCINYEGYVSLEWVKRWAPELCDAGIILPQFIDFMGQYTGKSSLRGKLYDNATKTGKFLWEKEHLIDLTFPQVLDRVCEEFPDQYAFRYTTLDYTRTYKQFRDDVDTFARALIAMGVKRGDHVAIWATNVPAWYITFWATVKIGAVLVTVNTAYKIYEVEYLLKQSDTHTLVMTDEYKGTSYVDIIKELCPELSGHNPASPLYAKRLPFLRNIITVESKQEGCFTFDEAMALSEKVPVEEV